MDGCKIDESILFFIWAEPRFFFIIKFYLDVYFYLYFSIPLSTLDADTRMLEKNKKQQATNNSFPLSFRTHPDPGVSELGFR